MAAIARFPLDISEKILCTEAVWDAVAQATSAWSRRQGLALRDSIVVLPFVQLLAPARRAFARAGGWQPRIETTQTICAALGPAPPAQAMQLSFDAAADRLVAARMLRNQDSGRAWARADPRGFERGVAAMVETAQALARAAAAVAPIEREAHWAAARERLAPLAGPGARERWLARVALEWAALAPTPATDRLFVVQPGAWVVVQAGGVDPLVEAVLRASAVPALVLDADTLAPASAPAVPSRMCCDDFEHEAQAAAAQVLAHLSGGETPVALIGLDRQLVRRVRALLERSRVPLADETGWTLSTTRAAAGVMLLLRSASPRAAADTLFDWLKTLQGWPGRGDGEAWLHGLERHARRHRLARVADFARVALPPPLRAPWDGVLAVLQGLQADAQPVSRWLDALHAALRACGAWDGLQSDDAGRAVLTALRLDPGVAPGPAWRAAADTSLSLDGFTDWVDVVLESASYLPVPPEDGEALVVVTPLARAMLRPFAAVVCPGADDRRLGARPPPQALIADAMLPAIGLPDAAVRQRAQALAFAQLLRAPRLTLLRRRIDEGDPLAQSPLVERLALDLAARGRSIGDAIDPRGEATCTATPVSRPAPAAPELLPASLSASAAEALRECPYRFFARHLLRLREAEELDEEPEKRDYGNWLHAVLQAFHAGRAAPGSAEAECARLLGAAREVQQARGLSDEGFLPFALSFEALAPRYIAWLHARDAAGARWQASELECRVRPASLAGTELHGVIDRIDRVEGGAALELIDYKTGSADGLRRRVRDRQEDTQLAFYAALQAEASPLPLRAMYLAMDGGKAPEEIVHAEIADSARRLVDGLAADLARLRGGAGLPALGESPTCDHCEARGLCRRDHWAEGGEA